MFRGLHDRWTSALPLHRADHRATAGRGPVADAQPERSTVPIAAPTQNRDVQAIALLHDGRLWISDAPATAGAKLVEKLWTIRKRTCRRSAEMDSGFLENSNATARPPPPCWASVLLPRSVRIEVLLLFGVVSSGSRCGACVLFDVTVYGREGPVGWPKDCLTLQVGRHSVCLGRMDPGRPFQWEHG